MNEQTRKALLAWFDWAVELVSNSGVDYLGVINIDQPKAIRALLSQPPPKPPGKLGKSRHAGPKELLDWLEYWLGNCVPCDWCARCKKTDPEQSRWCIEAEEKIGRLIRQLPPEPPILQEKSLMKLAADLGVSFSAAKIIYDKGMADHEPPSVSRENIEKALSDVRSHAGDGPVDRLIAMLAAEGITVEGEKAERMNKGGPDKRV